jgi:hypothetical protein
MATEVPVSVVSGQNFLACKFTYSPLHIFLDSFSLEIHSDLSLYSHHVLITPYSFINPYTACPSEPINTAYRHTDGGRNRPSSLRASSAPILVAYKEEVDRVLLDYLCD